MIKLNRRDIALSLLLILVALLVRFVLLDKIPSGLHGDEAWGGIWARQIISHYDLPIFTGDALGNVTGPSYIIALFFHLFGESVFTLRLPIAFMGALSIPLFYLFLRLFFRRFSSFVTSCALCFSLMHIHYSRTAFFLITTLVFQISSLIFLFLGTRRKNYWHIGFAAIFAGLGMYTYNSFVLYPATVALFLALRVFASRFNKFSIYAFLLFIFVFILTGSGLFKLIYEKPDFYLGHFKTYSIANYKPIRDETDNLKKLSGIAANGLTKVSTFFVGRQLDFADGYGKYRSFNIAYLVFFALGLFVVIKKRNEEFLFVVGSLFLIILSSFLTIEGTYRRIILTLPYLYFLMAAFISLAFQKSKNRFLVISIVSIVIICSAINLYTYFVMFAGDIEAKWVFADDLARTAEFMQKYNPSTEFLFYSSRWSCNYETVRFIAPDITCYDRAHEFGTYSLQKSPHKSTAFVLIGNYMSKIDEIKKMYPQGAEEEVYSSDQSVALIYYLSR